MNVLLKVTLYMKERCALCDEVLDLLSLLQADYLFSIEEVDIYQDETLLERYHLDIPVVRIKDTLLKAGEIDIITLEAAIKSQLS